MDILDVLGVHVFAVDSATTPDPNLMVISISNGIDTLQFGPIISENNKKQIRQSIFSDFGDDGFLLLGGDITWHVIDLMRVCHPIAPGSFPTSLLEADNGKLGEFRVHEFYKANEENRARSREIASSYGNKLSPYGEKPAVRYKRRYINASIRLLQHYAEKVPLFRLKWQEIQGETTTMNPERYEMSILPTTTADAKAYGDDCMRIKLVMTDYHTHIMQGTRLVVEADDFTRRLEAHLVGYDKNTVAFVLQPKIELKSISSLVIIRGDERQYDILAHLWLARSLISERKSRQGGLQFCAEQFGLHIKSQRELREHRASEAKIASAHKMDAFNQIRDDLVHTFVKKHKSTVATGIKAIRADVYRPKLNKTQVACARSSSPVVICQGYPGTGKTQTLAAMIKLRFASLLQRPSGWLLAMSNNNASTLNMFKHISRYTSLVPFLHHGYSKIYQAYHPTMFRVSYDYRLTPNKFLPPHGILVCTTGSLGRIFNKWTHLKNITFDLITDESGIIWNFDALIFLCQLNNLMRWALFGDSRQLAPYVTRMLKMDVYYPSVMSLWQSGSSFNITIPFKLDIQYRMIPELCLAHAPVFYDYPITSFRSTPSPNHNHGLFVDRLPSGTEIRGQLLEEYEAKRALQIHRHIEDLKLINSDNLPYTIFILSPYKKTVQRIEALAQSMNKIVTVSTVDCIQGDEADAVIVATSRSSCGDLNKCRSRGNVATSRAKNILILMLHRKMALDSVKDVNVPGQRRLRFWGQITCSAKQFNHTDHQASKLLYDVNNYTPPPNTRHHSITRVNHYMRMAADALLHLQVMTGNNPSNPNNPNNPNSFVQVTCGIPKGKFRCVNHSA